MSTQAGAGQVLHRVNGFDANVVMTEALRKTLPQDIADARGDRVPPARFSEQLLTELAQLGFYLGVPAP